MMEETRNFTFNEDKSLQADFVLLLLLLLFLFLFVFFSDLTPLTEDRSLQWALA